MWHSIWGLIIVDGVTVDWKSIKILKLWEDPHDKVDLIFCLQVDVETAEDGHGRDGLNAELEVLKDDVLQIQVCNAPQLRQVLRQVLKLIVRQIEFFQVLELREKIDDDVEVFDLLILQVKECGVRLVRKVLRHHLLQVLLAH